MRILRLVSLLVLSIKFLHCFAQTPFLAYNNNVKEKYYTEVNPFEVQGVGEISLNFLLSKQKSITRFYRLVWFSDTSNIPSVIELYHRFPNRRKRRRLEIEVDVQVKQLADSIIMTTEIVSPNYKLGAEASFDTVFRSPHIIRVLIYPNAIDRQCITYEFQNVDKNTVSYSKYMTDTYKHYRSKDLIIGKGNELYYNEFVTGLCKKYNDYTNYTHKTVFIIDFLQYYYWIKWANP